MKKQKKTISTQFESSLSFLILTVVGLVFLLSLCSSSMAAEVTLTWDANSESNLSGYNIYYKAGSSGAPYDGRGADQGDSGISVPIGSLVKRDSPSYLLTGLPDGKDYYFVVTAVDNSGNESGYSNEVMYESSLPVMTYTITSSSSFNGSISPAGATTLTQGSNQIYIISPDANYRINDVQVDSVSVGPVSEYTFSDVNGNHTIVASFEVDTFSVPRTITASCGANGSISPNGLINVTPGSDMTFAITPNVNYRIKDVQVDGVSIGAASSYTFSNIFSDHTITAAFEINAYVISASSGLHGSIAPSGSVSVTRGGSKSFSLTPEAGYQIDQITIDGVAVTTSNSYSFTNVTSNHTISVSFSSSTLTISASVNGNGSISPDGSIHMEKGSSQTFVMTPDKNHRVSDVLIDGVSAGAIESYTFSNVSADHTIAAQFDAEEQNNPTIEVGEKSINNQWVRIEFENSYAKPVVVAKPVSIKDKDPSVVRIRNIDSTGFEIRLQEWDYLDGIHAPETVFYMVIEKGSYVLEDGTRLEAGVFSTQKTDSYEAIIFKQPFRDIPVVIASITSYQEQDAVTGRIRGIRTDGFEYRMQEQELNRNSHVAEEISYLAWEPSAGTLNDIAYEVGKTGNEVTNNLQTIAFNREFQNSPFFLADMQTANGGDTANIRWQNKDAYAVDVLIAEEQSKDNEINHIKEVIGYFALEYVGLKPAGDDTPPDVTVISPMDGDTFLSGGDTITFEGSAMDGEDGDLSADLIWYSSIDGKIGTGKRFSTTLSDGIHTITASVTDTEGQDVKSTINITVETDQPEMQNTPPVASIISPADGHTFISGDTITFEGSAFDNEDGDLSSDLVWRSSIDGQIGTGKSFSTTLSDGIHTITASVTDSDGQDTNTSINFTVEINQPSDAGTVNNDDNQGSSFWRDWRTRTRKSRWWKRW